MNYASTNSPVKLDSKGMLSSGRLSITEVLALSLEFQQEHYKDLSITQYSRAKDYVDHMAQQIAQSNVTASTKWHLLHEFANDLKDQNLDSTIIDDIKTQLLVNIALLNKHVRLYNANEIVPDEKLIYFAVDDHEERPKFNMYQLFLINEINRSIEEQKEIFVGISGLSLVIIILNKMKSDINQFSKKFFDLVTHLKCGLIVIAESNLLEWNGSSWEPDYC